MAMTKQELLDEIDGLTIYSYDYKIILELINECDDSLFTRICESVVSGELYWSDFEKILANTEYPRIISENIEKQAALKNELNCIAALIQDNVDENFTFSNKESFLALTNQYSADEKEVEFFNKEWSNIQNNIIYDLSKPNPNDSVLATACKLRLVNAIRNGEILLEHKSDIRDDNTLNIDGQTYSISDTAITSYDGKRYYEYIGPNDILLFLDNYIIPLDYRYITLNSFDYEYAAQNGLSEDVVKQIKSLALFMRKTSALSTGE